MNLDEEMLPKEKPNENFFLHTFIRKIQSSSNISRLRVLRLTDREHKRVVESESW